MTKADWEMLMKTVNMSNVMAVDTNHLKSMQDFLNSFKNKNKISNVYLDKDYTTNIVHVVFESEYVKDEWKYNVSSKIELDRIWDLYNKWQMKKLLSSP